jgi:predicted PurR-regulated permease PerM
MRNWKYWFKYIIPFALGVLVFSFITQYDRTVALFSTLLSGTLYLTKRFIIGFGLAYFLNFPMRFMERKFKIKRWASIILTYVIALGVIVMIVWFVAPSLVDSVSQILSTSQDYYVQVHNLVINIFGALPTDAQQFLNGTLRNLSDGIMDYLNDLISMDQLGGALTDILNSSIRTILNIAFGLFISFYALWDKEKLTLLMKRLLYAVWSKPRADKVLELSRETDVKFSRFIIGKIWESVLVGILSLIIYSVVGLPVPMFLAFVTGLTNVVPFFGPIVGGVINAIILLGFSPMNMLIGVIIVVAVQAIDNAVIAPKILGDATGLSPLMVIIAITVGADLFGLPGIFLAAPVVGTLKHVVVDKLLNRRLKEQGVDIDEPEKPLEGQMEMCEEEKVE